MRLLVACSKCRRQYDATDRTVGERFRCHCGAAVTVRQPESHEAAVVRCSSCGAPRESGAPNCRFCGADFSLHERDLHTVCPSCFARVSDRADYCHHCGGALAPEGVAGEQTALCCPACDGERKLVGRNVGGVPVLECGQCAGLWLGEKTFSELVRRAKDRAAGLDPFFTASRSSSGEADGGRELGKWRYRNCPECGKMMHRRQYGEGSGVILDTCRDHGIWFDADEMPRILAWVRSGKAATAAKNAATDRARRQRDCDESRPPMTASYDRDDGAPVGWMAVLAGIAVDLFSDWDDWWR